jgi:hypothetical protein
MVARSSMRYKRSHTNAVIHTETVHDVIKYRSGARGLGRSSWRIDLFKGAKLRTVCFASDSRVVQRFKAGHFYPLGVCSVYVIASDGLEHTLFLHGRKPSASRETFRLIVSKSARAVGMGLSGSD